MNTVLANPPTSVIAVMPRRDRGPSRLVSTAKPGSYNTALMVAPMPIQIRRKTG
jgi:hypothetical protein